MTMPSRTVRERLAEILATQSYTIPSGEGFGGTGAPGLYLEHLLGLKTSNADIPDAGAWEVKYTSGTALTTLFHKDPFPRRGQAIRYIINRWGWIGSKNNRPSFRHTICGESDRFIVVDDAGSIWVRRKGYDDIAPHWPHDELITAFARKLSKLILVRGSYDNTKRLVSYDSAEFLSQPRTSQLVRAIVTGLICIDFDAWIRESGAIRNHGTKFRVHRFTSHLRPPPLCIGALSISAPYFAIISSTCSEDSLLLREDNRHCREAREPSPTLTERSPWRREDE